MQQYRATELYHLAFANPEDVSSLTMYTVTHASNWLPRIMKAFPKWDPKRRKQLLSSCLFEDFQRWQFETRQDFLNE